jgi:hypothetical protein
MYNIPAAERGKGNKKQIQSRKRHDDGGEIQQLDSVKQTSKQTKTWAFTRVHLVGRLSE